MGEGLRSTYHHAAVIATILSALALPLALPNELLPLGNPLLALICLVPYFVTLRRCADRWRARRLGVLFGFLSTVGVHYWLVFYGEFSVWTISSVSIGYAACHWLLSQILWHFLRIERPWSPFAVGMLWAGYEFLKSSGYLGFPWGLMSQPFGALLPLVQHVDITGLWALSAVAVACNAAIAGVFSPSAGVAWRSAGRLLGRQGALLAVIVVIMLGYGMSVLRNPLPIERHLSTTLVQQNHNAWENDGYAQSIAQAQQLTTTALEEARRAGIRSDVVLWSESSLPFPYEQSRDYYQSSPAEQPFNRFLEQTGHYLLTGVPYVDPRNPELAYNSAALFGPVGRISDYYSKRHLIPFAEHVPFWEHRVARQFIRDVIGLTGTWSPGRTPGLLHLPLHNAPQLPLGILICFEDSFAPLARDLVREGARVLMNLTNNAWSETNSAQMQHFVSARFRAIETRTALVRSTNTGLTTVVDAYGHTTQSLPMFQAGYLNVSAPIYAPHPHSIYVRFGDWLAWCFLLACLGVTLLSARRQLDSPT